MPSLECVKLTYINTICWYPDYPTCYTAGSSQVTLTGNIPADRSWDGKTFKLQGYLVENNNCTMFFVKKATACPSITPAPTA